MPKTQQQLHLPCAVLCNPGQMCQTSMLTEQLSKSLLGVYGIFLSLWHWWILIYRSLCHFVLSLQLCQLLVFMHIACCIWIFKSPFLCAVVTRSMQCLTNRPRWPWHICSKNGRDTWSTWGCGKVNDHPRNQRMAAQFETPSSREVDVGSIRFIRTNKSGKECTVQDISLCT